MTICRLLLVEVCMKPSQKALCVVESSVENIVLSEKTSEWLMTTQEGVEVQHYLVSHQRYDSDKGFEELDAWLVEDHIHARWEEE